MDKMDFKDFKGLVKIKNKSDGRVVSDAFSLGHDDEVTINTQRLPKSVLEDLNIFYVMGAIEVDTNVTLQNVAKDGNVRVVETLKGEEGKETNEHVVFDPESAKKDRLLKTEIIDNNNKAIKVNAMNKEDAVDFLGQHWKRIEKDVEAIIDVSKLEYLLSVADELGMTGNKKHEILKGRINELR
jgi:hypothetical protein